MTNNRVRIVRWIKSRTYADKIIREQVRTGKVNTGPTVDYDALCDWLNARP